MLTYFAARGSLPMLAYLSADNEINNHCANSGRDCFDASQGFDAQGYIDGAIGWVALWLAGNPCLQIHRTPHLLAKVRAAGFGPSALRV